MKSEHHRLYQISWSLWTQLSWKKSLLVICKFLRLFLNTLTSHHKNFLLNRENLRQTLQMQLSQKQKTFSQFFLHFWKVDKILNSFKLKMLLIADVFSKLRTPKNVVKQISKKSPFRGPFDKKHVKGDRTLLKSERHNLYHIYLSLSRHLSCKKSLLVICKYLRLFLNTLTADHKYSLLHRDNLRQQIQMELSQKQKTLFQFAAAF